MNSSSACLAHIPAVVFSASTSLLRRMRSRIRFLSCAASSRRNLAFVSSSKAGLLSKLAGILRAAVPAADLGAAVVLAGVAVVDGAGPGAALG